MLRSGTLFLGLVASLGSVVAQTPPTLALPWGKYQASPYENDNNIYLFQNVRFGGRPERFGPSARPGGRDPSPEIDGSISCIQIDPSLMDNPPGGHSNGSTAQPPLFDPNPNQSEDCLFLDIYAPANAFDSNGNPTRKLPVIVWFHGGAFAYGSKDLGQDLPLYTGQSMLAAQNYEAIFVSGNYRLGAFGWLAGAYMDSDESNGLPNAGLWDQALLLQWVQDYISLAAGNPASVSAWGESAGAGSIMHHLTRQGGTVDPLFKTFLVQSPAFEWAWDNSTGGVLDQTYETFSNLSGCGYAYDMKCLRSRTLDELATANQALFANTRTTGIFPVGPSVDVNWVQNIPALSFASGQYWPADRINSALISHVSNETASFTPKSINSYDTFVAFVSRFFSQPDLKTVVQQVLAQYDCKIKYGGDYWTCAATLIRDAFFTCNTRQLFEAYPKQSYMLRYNFPNPTNAVHASDLIPTFMNGYLDAYNILRANNVSVVDAGALATALDLYLMNTYQGYLSSFGVYGDPNTGAEAGSLSWPTGAPGASIGNVMETPHIVWKDIVFPVPTDWVLIDDDQNTQKSCDFWTGIAKEIAATIM